MKPTSISKLGGVPLLVLALVLWRGGGAVYGQAPIIVSFGQNGVLVCTNLEPGSVASVEWAPTVLGPWTNTWAGLDAVTVDSNGVIRVSVPMFYRVRGLVAVSLPAGMALIPAGSFTMGDTFGEGDSDERPTHSVYVSGFYLDKYELTKGLWDEVRAWAVNNGYSFEYGAQGKANDHPAHSMTWYDAVKWCNARSEKEGLVPAYYTDAGLTQRYRSGQVSPYVNWGSGYRLPTEAEWEKAARGGSSGRRFPWGDADNITHSRANYYSDSNYAYDTSPTREFHPTFAIGGYPYTSPVGYSEANGYGLYDMVGNVWEWCWDWYSGSYYSSSPGTDPRDPTSGSGRVNRGGSWGLNARGCRAANRYLNNPSFRSGYMGFRCARAAGQ